MTFPFHAFAQTFSAHLLNTTVEGTALVACLWAVLRLCGRQNSRTRFMIWFVALVAIAALPFIPNMPVDRAPALAHAAARAEIILPSSWAIYLLSIWIVGVLLAIAKLSVGFWRVRQLRRSFRQFDLASLDPASAQVLHSARRQTKLYVSAALTAPAAIGFFRPAIVFPASLIRELSPEEMRLILLHELAHLSRWDDWTNLAQKLVKAVFFFHPGIWWLENRLALEREMACDDIVLAHTRSPKTYASFLVTFTEKVQRTRTMALVQGLLSRLSQMSARVGEILDPAIPVRHSARKPLIAFSTALFAVALGVAPRIPQIVTFRAHPAHGHVIAAAEISPGLPVAKKVALPGQPAVIPALYRPPTAKPVLLKKLKKQPTPKLLRAQATTPDFPAAQVLVVFQNANDNLSGSDIWSICIYQFNPGTGRGMQLQSAIVFKI